MIPYFHRWGILWLCLAVGCSQFPEHPTSLLLSTPSPPSCDCYYTLDCQSPGFTQNAPSTMLICERNWHASSVCDEDNFTSTTKYLDGLCQTLSLAPDHAQVAVQALDAWLQAYEAAGRVGGPPDSQMIRAAQPPALTGREQNAIRSLVFHILSLALGLTTYPDGIPHARGFFTMPVSSRESDDPASLEGYGQVTQLNETYRGALGLIRKGLIGAFTDPTSNSLRNTFSHIRQQYPGYRPFTRCEYPHPPSHGHLFPYSDGIACLEEELRMVVLSLRPPTR